MMNIDHMYREIKDALKDQIQTELSTVGEVVDVYKVNYQNIAMFPAVTIEAERRRKRKAGVGRVRELQFEMNVWVYVKILDYEDAEAECLRVTDRKSVV